LEQLDSVTVWIFDERKRSRGEFGADHPATGTFDQRKCGSKVRDHKAQTQSTGLGTSLRVELKDGAADACRVVEWTSAMLLHRQRKSNRFVEMARALEIGAAKDDQS